MQRRFCIANIFSAVGVALPVRISATTNMREKQGRQQ
jgi:hypothetical protein